MPVVEPNPKRDLGEILMLVAAGVGLVWWASRGKTAKAQGNVPRIEGSYQIKPTSNGFRVEWSVNNPTSQPVSLTLETWLDGKKAAELAASFRPCDVFPPGLPKRNFIAAERDGSSGFEGIIDFVVLYHTVHDDYSKVPPPTKDAPRRPTADFIAALEKKYGAVAVLNARANALARKTMAPYERLFRQCREREQELLNRSPDYRKAVANLKAAEEAAARRKRQLAAEFDRLPENARTKTQLQEMRGKVDAMRRQVRDLERKFFEQDQELVGLELRRSLSLRQRFNPGFGAL